ncbi:alpha-amylase-related protein-like, partial [Macrosteles quadrilineatus]|uniref:alpha-amylase-related protein-like n=1 Tax=Macrosteles quadrilineatus TaxID=74068 RepID=UPI0023E28E43
MLLALELPRLLISSTMLTAVGVVYLLVGVCLADKTLDLENGVIVHMFEWPYSEIARECEEFLGPRGFAGVQLSPSTEHIVAEGQWWERYQVVSYHLVSRSGDEEHLRNMITRCNRAGVWVFADVVFNHMTADRDNCRGFGGTMCYPRDKSYPGVPYSSKDFHDRYCNGIDYKDAGQVRECELDGLHDLNQALESVRKPIVELLNKLIEFGVAGFRIDAAKHMHPDDLKIIYERLNYLNTKHGFEEKTKPLIYQEVIDKD